MIIKEDFCSYEVAKLLKEKGMDKFCFNHYVQKNNNDGTSEAVTVCTHQMAMKWLREMHNIFIDIYLPSHSEREDTIYHGTYSFDIFNLNTKVYVYCTWGEIEFNSYEEAVEAACLYALKNLI